MPLHVLLIVGPNTLDVNGDVPFNEVVALARLWLEAVAPAADPSLQARLDRATQRVEAQNQALKEATEKTTITPSWMGKQPHEMTAEEIQVHYIDPAKRALSND